MSPLVYAQERARISAELARLDEERARLSGKLACLDAEFARTCENDPADAHGFTTERPPEGWNARRFNRACRQGFASGDLRVRKRGRGWVASRDFIDRPPPPKGIAPPRAVVVAVESFEERRAAAIRERAAKRRA